MNIYVGNLSYDFTEDDLRGLFQPFGEIASAAIITDKYSGRSKGFGFVEMPDKESATSAIAELNGKEIGGRALNVNEARPKEKRDNNRGGDRGGDRGGYKSKNRW